MQYDSSSSSSSSEDDSSSDDDMDLLFLEMAFAPKRKLGVRINIKDIGEEECELLFR